MTLTVNFTVNDEALTLDLEARETLLDVVRHRLGLTGTHAGCEQGACGACTVLLDGEVARSCLVLAVQAAGHRVTTIEAVGRPDRLHPVQAALRDHHGLQCGFCTPAIVLGVIDLLTRNPRPDDGEVREALAGNLCRCTGYSGIVAAVGSLATGGRDAAAPARSGSAGRSKGDAGGIGEAGAPVPWDGGVPEPAQSVSPVPWEDGAVGSGGPGADRVAPA